MEQDSIRETKEVSECQKSLLSELMVSLYNTVIPGPCGTPHCWSAWITFTTIQESFLEEENVRSYLYQPRVSPSGEKEGSVPWSSQTDKTSRTSPPHLSRPLSRLLPDPWQLPFIRLQPRCLKIK